MPEKKKIEVSKKMRATRKNLRKKISRRRDKNEREKKRVKKESV